VSKTASEKQAARRLRRPASHPTPCPTSGSGSVRGAALEWLSCWPSRASGPGQLLPLAPPICTGLSLQLSQVASPSTPGCLDARSLVGLGGSWAADDLKETAGQPRRPAGPSTPAPLRLRPSARVVAAALERQPAEQLRVPFKTGATSRPPAAGSLSPFMWAARLPWPASPVALPKPLGPPWALPPLRQLDRQEADALLQESAAAKWHLQTPSGNDSLGPCRRLGVELDSAIIALSTWAHDSAMSGRNRQRFSLFVL